LEALACGLPVITTMQNGASELLTDGLEGYVVSAPGAQEELIAALGRMTDDDARRTMSIQARRLGQFQTFELHVARLMAIFEKVAATRTRSVPHSRKREAKAPAPHIDQSKKAGV
jgi:UDP-glucose:(heptosyl)LPS alpha-1,3-glucosyltransferase